MKLLYDFFPLLLFFVAFSLYDIYVATAAAMAATLLQVIWHRYRTQRFEKLHLITLGVLLVFGGMTLLLKDDTFIRWKPTVVYAILAALVFASQFASNRTLIERLLGSQIALPARIWKRLNVSWGCFFVLLGALNLYVAFYYGLDQDAQARLALWAKFKVFGLTGLTLAFVIGQNTITRGIVSMYYAVIATDVENSLERRLSARPAHIERLQHLKNEGRLLLAGPFPAIDSEDPGPAGFSGSLIVAEFASLEEARAWADADPYVAAGVYADVSVKPFRKVLP